jgi:hypothetical protein
LNSVLASTGAATPTRFVVYQVCGCASWLTAPLFCAQASEL